MNKKKLLALLMALVMTLTLVPVTAFATEIDSLQDLVNNAVDTITLSHDYSLSSPVEINKNVEINLNGHSITGDGCRALWIKSGNVVLSGNGTVSSTGLAEGSSVVRVGDAGAQNDATPSSPASLTVGNGVTITTANAYGVTVFGKCDEEVGQTLIVNGKIEVTGGGASAISGNGNNWLAKTNITINEGATVSAVGSTAIYHPQDGTLTINGGTVSGKGGIEAKGGVVIVKGGSVTATETADQNANNNGNSTVGYALAAVENNGYKGDANFEISGGTFYGPVAVLEDSAASWQPTITITGGTFNPRPAEDYIAEGYMAKSVTGGYEVVSAGEAVAQVNDGTKYATLVEAVAAAQAGDTVKLLKNIDLGSEALTIDKALTIDGGADRHSITSTNLYVIEIPTSAAVTIKNAVLNARTRGIHVGQYDENNDAAVGTANVTVDNVVIQLQGVSDYDNSYIASVDGYTMGIAMHSTGGTVTINNTTIQGVSYCINPFTVTSNLTVNVTGGSLKGRAALNVWGGHNRFTLNNVVVHGLNNQTGPQEGFACIVDNQKDYSVPGYPVLGNNNNEYVLDGCTFKAKLSSAAYSTAGSSATEYLIDLRGPDSIALFKGNTTYAAYVGDQVITLPDSKFGLIANESCVLKNIVILDDDAKQSLSNALNALSTGIKQITYPENNEYTQLVINEGAYDVGYYYYNDNNELILDGLWKNMGDLMVANSKSSGHYFCNDEFLRLNRNVTINDAYTFDMRSGHTSFGLEFGDYSITLGENGSLTIPVGVSINTDKAVAIFSAPEGYKVVEISNGDGTFTYSVAQVTAVAKIGTMEYTSLQAAFNAVQTGQTIELLTDVTLSEPMNVTLDDKTVTLDLGGHTLTGRTNLRSGNLTIQNGTVAGGKLQALNVYGSDNSSAENYSVLTLASNVTVTADEFAVCMFGKTATANGYGAVVYTAATIHTKDNGAIFVSGNLGNNIPGEAKNVINVTGGSITSDNNCAIALNGLATVNVTGGTLRGNTAITVKRGTLNVQNGATLVANGVKVDPAAANNNGTEMTGAAISVTPTYSKYGGMAVNVSGGTITSNNNAALYVGHSYDSGKNKTVTFTHPVTLNVTGGSFNGGDGAVFVADTIDGDAKMPANFITGGTYSAEPDSSYVANGYKAVALSGIDGVYFQVGKASIETDSGIVDNVLTYTVQTTVKESEGENPATLERNEDLKITVVGNDTEKTNKDGSGVDKAALSNISDSALDKIVTDAIEAAGASIGGGTPSAEIVIQLAKSAADKTTVNNTVTKLTFEVHPEAVISVDGTEVGTVALNNNQLGDSANFTFTLDVSALGLPNGSTNVRVTHKHSDNSEDTVYNNLLVVNGKVTITGVRSFSEFVAEKIGNTENSAKLTFEGTSLRRRVSVVNEEKTPNVVRSSTDARFEFSWVLPTGYSVVRDESKFEWSKDGVNWTEATVESINGNGNGANLVIAGIPSWAFNTAIHTRLTLAYTDGSTPVKTTTLTAETRTVNEVANKLAKSTTADLKWVDYAKYLLGTYNTYTIDAGATNGYTVA